MKNNVIVGMIMLCLVTGVGYAVFTHKPEVIDESGGYGGLSVEEARDLADSRGVVFRIVEIDGEAQAVTADYVVGRVNAEIEEGVVRGYYIEE